MSNTFKAAASNNSSPQCPPDPRWISKDILERSKVTHLQRLRRTYLERYCLDTDYTFDAAIAFACCAAEAGEKVIIFDASNSLDEIREAVCRCCEWNDFDYYRVGENILIPNQGRMLNVNDVLRRARRCDVGMIEMLNLPSPTEDPLFKGHDGEPLWQTLANIASDSDTAVLVNFRDFDGAFKSDYQYNEGKVVMDPWADVAMTYRMMNYRHLELKDF